ncbi:uncharacterized protein LOC129723705 [Wyeomyia smithii]|uniref:uncharacterized protein LOC129723705 n=1 Tax=Wyeomyia smithii TaxID=174621 RepID=UPI002468177D|nr:uncharacterized protein LOC129723705 [Wyeomyia smithii]
MQKKRDLGTSFYKLPDRLKDNKRWREWVNLLKLKYVPLRHEQVCSNHFRTTDFFIIKSLVRETAKYLVSVTPGGCLNYVSQGYVGRASDKFIFNASDMISLFDKHDAVMVDKGFAIKKELEQRNLELVRPPTLINEQFNIREARDNVSITGARVHVERGIQRMKNFKILTEKVDLAILHLLDDIMVIIAGVVNLSAPILSDDRFVSVK